MITLANAELEAWTEANVSITGVNVKGLAKALFYSPGKNYYGDFTLDNSVVEMAGDAITFDWTKGSVVKKFTVTNSTIYAPTATTKFLYSSQGGQKVTEYDAAQLQTFLLKNSTFYNLNPTKNFFNHRQTNQTFFVYDLEDNIFVNCGKSGQVVKGVNGGQSGKNPTWIVKGNVFNFDGADTSAEESTGDEEEPVQNSIAGVVTFTDAAGGDFNGSIELPAEGEAPAVGDPRWTLTVAVPVVVPATLTVDGVEGPVPSLVAFEWPNGVQYTGPARIEDGVAVVYVRSFEKAVADGNPTLKDASKEATADNFASWDSQFFINFGEENALKAGDKLQLKMKIKGDAGQSIETQCHKAPGAYVHYYAVGDINATTEWVDFVSNEVEAMDQKSDGNYDWGKLAAGIYTIAFNLAKGGENNLYFDAIQVIITSKVDGITKVIDVVPANNGPIYNLSGQRVSESYKGVVIRNGKKYIAK
jgi:hypothetical protein